MLKFSKDTSFKEQKIVKKDLRNILKSFTSQHGIFKIN
jgi:hypothetical protein